MRRTGLVPSLILAASVPCCAAKHLAAEVIWESVAQLAPHGRFDAVTYLGRGYVLIGSRERDSGHLFQSQDRGVTWSDFGRPIKGAILNLLCVDEQTVLASTQEGHIWKSRDRGKTWSDRGQVSSRRIYSLARAADGSVLAAEYHETGSRIYKSTDGGDHWKAGAIVSPKELYRLQPVGDGMLVNGEAGHVYKSVDCGDTWKDSGQLTSAPLYAIESLPNRVVLLGDGNGKVFRSEDDGNSWRLVQDVGDALDDFVPMSDGLVFLSAYDGRKHLYRSVDAGLTWQDVGPTPDGDVLDHAIVVNDVVPPVVIGGTNQGRVLRAVNK